MTCSFQVQLKAINICDCFVVVHMNIHCYTLATTTQHNTIAIPLLHAKTRQLPCSLNKSQPTMSSTDNNTFPFITTSEFLYFFPPFFLEGTTLKLPLAGSSLGVSGLAGPFFATSLQPPGAALAGLPLLGGVEVSTRPLSASLLRRMNSSAKWRESMVELLPWTASVMSSASAGKKMRSATNCSAVNVFVSLCLVLKCDSGDR